MKVLHIINNLGTGGAEKLLIDTIPLFNKKKRHVDLLTLDGNEYPYLKKLKASSFLSVHSLNSRNIYNPLNIFKLIPYLRKYDLIHVHLFPAQYWVVLAKIFSFSKTKLVFTEHSTSNKRIVNSFFRVIDKFIYKFYAKVICISDEIKDVLVKHLTIDESKLIVIENGIDIELFTKTVSINKSEINKNILDSDKLLIQVAGFRYQKDQVTAIKCLQHLPQDIKLLLVGDGEFRNDLEKLVNSLGLNERVFFLGIRLDVPVLLKSSDIVVISSHWEGMPLSVIEGMASNKPVVASNVPGVFQLVADAGLLFQKGNDRELASKIEELLCDDVYYNEIAEKGFKHAQQFDVGKMIEKQMILYKELLEK
ncbi:glycosyltransferase [Flavobacterium artemisiae]|uniref:Glycosyltransferase n=1 Tax=Flavobacterium artemisiae TaxID=2126556 RepID=A0ABW4H8V4_9FLAO